MTCPEGACLDDTYKREMLTIIQGGIDEHDRSRQVEVGPSEIGGCERKLAWKLAYGGDSARPGGWAAHKGTVMHAWLDDLFKRTEARMPDGSQRFYSDLKLPKVAAHVNGGTLDIYDKLWATVVDWKVPGEATVKKARAGTFARGYKVQPQVYGVGAEAMGFKVARVGLMYLPQCGDDLHGGAVFRFWDYDPAFAWTYLNNVGRIKNMLAVAPVGKVLAVMQTQEDFCHSCPAFIGSRDRRAMCPGANRKGVIDQDANPFAR